MKTIEMQLGADSYPIHVGRGLLARAGELLRLDRRVLVLTDDGVPPAYAEAVAAVCGAPVVLTVPAGEGSKSMETLSCVLSAMLDARMTRTDALVAVGGGVCGDLGGFAASLYMRGIDFYNVPTTLLSQVDSSIGGKTGINFGGVKNTVGSFHQPRAVLIDPDLLATLPRRQLLSGLAEVIKMAATSDAALFEEIESAADPLAIVDRLIPRALEIKRAVVEADPREGGLRRILNFGHTVGHGIESAAEGSLLHGECVALGMLALASPAVRTRLHAVYRRIGLPTAVSVDRAAVLAALSHDKKMGGDAISYVYVPAVGSYEIRTTPLADFLTLIKEDLFE